MESAAAKSKTYHDLFVWQKAHQFVLRVYANTKAFPREEVFGLTSQLRRSAVSIVANVVEGYKRKGAKEKLRFLNISQASLEESRYFLELARDLKYCDDPPILDQIEEVSRLLNAYRRSIEKGI